ncbi:MAG: fructose-1,6-bisphosphatase [Streptococcus sp.]|nr:fructose-1,6-bisphosphatase [Streptococcus sp.]
MDKAKYFKLLKEKFKTKSEVLTEIINLDAINHLPKGTEHFMSDLHGEYDSFDYILRNGSGMIEKKVIECLSNFDYTKDEIEELCQFIYYPEKKLEQYVQLSMKKNIDKWLMSLIPDLLTIVQYVGSKYTRSKIRKLMPKGYVYILDELLSENEKISKDNYFQAIISKIESLHELHNLVIAICYLIQDLVVDHLHIVGDIYDRGLYPDKILNRLQKMRSVDIQWGNHDIIWMGAFSGSLVCMINVIRIAARYGNLELIEERYGINLRYLVDYSRKYYLPLPTFKPSLDKETVIKVDEDLLNVVQQATAILQFKLEHQLIQRRSEFKMHHRLILDKVNYETKEIKFNGKIFPLNDFNDICINPENVSELSGEEEKMLTNLMRGFQNSVNLKQHIAFLFNRGSMYLKYNNQLLFHGCLPLHSNGDFKSFKIKGNSYSGHRLFDFYEQCIRQSYRNFNIKQDFNTDIFWYLWSGENSPLFGKQSMTTFERYYVMDKQTHIENKNAYYTLRNDKQICISILEDFGLDKSSHIINGHTPVLERKGENPIKASSKLLVIDGGFSKAYQKKTGIAGYTLLYTSYGLDIVAHKPINNKSTSSIEPFTTRTVERRTSRILVKETNIGKILSKEINDLEYFYQHFEDY